jgi:4-alpha-glucanotransferase
MSILQFAFGGETTGASSVRTRITRSRGVHGHARQRHHRGWWTADAGAGSTRTRRASPERAFARRYLGTDGREMHWTLIRAAMASVADTVVVPMQDVLGLGSEARMNLPGREAGNWRFRFRWSQVTPEIISRLREMTRLYDR